MEKNVIVVEQLAAAPINVAIPQLASSVLAPYVTMPTMHAVKIVSSLLAPKSVVPLPMQFVTLQNTVLGIHRHARVIRRHQTELTAGMDFSVLLALVLQEIYNASKLLMGVAAHVIRHRVR